MHGFESMIYNNPQAIAIASGKGGTGKSTISVNLSMALSELGKKVAILDANLELPSIQALLSIRPAYTIADLITGKCSMRKVVRRGPGGIDLILGNPLAAGMNNLTSVHHLGIVNACDAIASEVDVLVVDTAPGIGRGALNFISASHQVLLVTCSDPVALSSTNALIKTLNKDFRIINFHIVLNRVLTVREGQRAFKTLEEMNIDCLDIHLDYSGCILEDEAVRKAAAKGRAAFEMFPRSNFSLSLKKIARTISYWQPPNTPSGSIKFFFEHFVASNNK